jgi:outer membrane protein TolC
MASCHSQSATCIFSALRALSPRLSPLIFTLLGIGLSFSTGNKQALAQSGNPSGISKEVQADELLIGKSEWYRRLFALAQAHSPEVRAAQETARQKGAGWWSAFTRWLPRADLQLSASSSKDYSFITSGALGSLGSTPGMDLTPKAVTLGRWALNFSVPLYRRQVHLNLMQATLDSAQADAQLANRVSELDWKLRGAAANYLAQVYRELAVQKSIELGEAHLKETKIRVELGQKTKVDLLRSQANLSSWLGKRLSHKNAREADRHTLMDLMGISDGEWQELEAASQWGDVDGTAEAIEKFANLKVTQSVAAPWIQKLSSKGALERRVVESGPRYAQTLREGESSRHQVNSLMASEWPELTAQAGFNKQADVFSKLTEFDNVTYQFSIGLSIPLFTFGSLFSSWREMGAARRIAELRESRELQRVLSDTETLAQQISLLEQTLESTELQLSQQTEILRLTQKSYELGKAGILELLTSQNELLETKINWVKTKLDLSVGLRRFLWEIGV